ncbi:hypothetical protein AS73P1_00056 [Alistipes phage AS73P1]|nr:hypothetical protein AS73P1_00056 [Alistipes phage AS73P1]
MRTTTIAERAVIMYDAIDELPILRFHAYNKMLLIDAGIGSDLNDWDAHIEKAIRFIRKEKPDLAEKELDNLRQNVYFIQSGISPKHMAFACLVKSVDGTEYNDMTPDGLRKVLELFADAPNAELTAQLEAVKKKIDDEMQLYFPKLFDDATIKEYYDQLKQRTLLMLDAIIQGDDTDKRAEIDQITTLLMTYTHPQSFSGSDSMEIRYDKQFENMCLMLSQHLHVNPKTFTVLEYYNAFEYIKEATKPKNAKAGKN